MAMTAEGGGSDGVNSPSKRNNHLVSPWARVVRGEPETITTHPQTSSPSSSPSYVAEQPAAASEASNADAEKPKKAAWNRPSLSNGTTAASPAPVMGALSWPALSESTKPSPKSLSSPATNSQEPVIPQSAHKQGTGQSKLTSAHNHTMPARQRSTKRGGGGSGGSASGSSAGGHSQNDFPNPSSPLLPLPFPIFPMPPNGFGNLVPAMPDHSPREPPYRANNWEPRAVGGFVQQPPVANDHRHYSRRSNFGPRGDGPHKNNFVGRREQDRRHYGNVRDANVHRGSPRGFIRPPPPSRPSFIPPQPMGPFGPMGYPDFVYIPGLAGEPFRGVPFIASLAAPPFVMPVPEPPLHARLIHQIEYYFSDANLVDDEFLKSNMDDQGWVSITLIAGFNRVRSMTNNIQMILESLRTSTFLEVQDDRVRRRNDWIRWIPNSGRLPANSGPQPLDAPGYDALTTSFQNISMEGTASKQNDQTAENGGKHFNSNEAHF